MAEHASITIRRRIEWADTDASGWYHNTAAFRLMEEGETALLDRLGILSQVYGRLPRVHIEADFLRTLRFWDPVDVHLRVAAVGDTSITYEVEIRSNGEVCFEGKAVAVLVTPEGKPTNWPEEHRRLLLTAGTE